jgi:hypothetical protein
MPTAFSFSVASASVVTPISVSIGLS